MTIAAAHAGPRHARREPLAVVPAPRGVEPAGDRDGRHHRPSAHPGLPAARDVGVPAGHPGLPAARDVGVPAGHPGLSVAQDVAVPAASRPTGPAVPGAAGPAAPRPAGLAAPHATVLPFGPGAVPAFGFPGEPPAGLGPWVPPLPAPEPGLSRAAGACLALLVLTVVAVTAVVVSAGLRTTTVAASSLDTTYVASVRENSTLTSRDASDIDLVGDGHAVCDALGANPSRQGVLTVFGALTRTTGWSQSDAAAVVGSAIGAYCPQHRTLIGR